MTSNVKFIGSVTLYTVGRVLIKSTSPQLLRSVVISMISGS